MKVGICCYAVFSCGCFLFFI